MNMPLIQLPDTNKYIEYANAATAMAIFTILLSIDFITSKKRCANLIRFRALYQKF
jgi:hypothetical protein